MNPFPSTPTPRRFLLAKRSTQSSQTPAAPPRFTSTPRFGSSSVPKPTQSKELDIEDDDDDDEEEEEDDKSGYGPEGGEEEGERQAKRGHMNDAMDIESDGLTASQEGAESPGDRGMRAREEIIVDSSDNEVVTGEEEEEEEGSPWGREPKRRKMSISPAPVYSSPVGDEGQSEILKKEEDGDFAPIRDVSIEKVEDALSTLSTSNSQQFLDEAQDRRMLQQPVFQPAPRFKPVEVEDTFEGLPAAFSPQRRGAKYVPGGLAAELQGWLSDVKGWEGDDEQRVAALSLRIYVDEVRPGKRMNLIRGHAASEDVSRRFILAGEGKLTGLGRRAEVRVGSVVVIGRPVWEIELEGGGWTVACDWSVESS